MEHENQIDVELLTGYLDNLGRGVVKQMLDLYTQQSEVYLSEIHLALTNQDDETWQDKCHKMKGAAGSVGLTLVHSLLVKIEKADSTWSQRQADVEKLQQLNKDALDSFNVWLSH